MTKPEVHARIAEIGIIPCIRVSTEHADFITKEIADAGRYIHALKPCIGNEPKLAIF